MDDRLPLAEPRPIRNLTNEELLLEIADAEAERLEHTRAEAEATTEDEQIYHWGRRSTANIYAQFCQAELQSRLLQLPPA